MTYPSASRNKHPHLINNLLIIPNHSNYLPRTSLDTRQNLSYFPPIQSSTEQCTALHSIPRRLLSQSIPHLQPKDAIINLPTPTWTKEKYPNLSRMPSYRLPLGTTTRIDPLTKLKTTQLTSSTSSPPPTNNKEDGEELQIALQRSL